MKGFWVLKGIKILILIVFFVVLMGSVVMWLWNWLMPTLFSLPFISLEQAIGLTVMCRILAGGIRFGGGASKEHWQQKRQMWEKWSAMSPEERTRWKEDWRNRCSQHRSKMGFKRHDEQCEEGTDQI